MRWRPKKLLAESRSHSRAAAALNTRCAVRLTSSTTHLSDKRRASMRLVGRFSNPKGLGLLLLIVSLLIRIGLVACKRILVYFRVGSSDIQVLSQSSLQGSAASLPPRAAGLGPNESLVVDGEVDEDADDDEGDGKGNGKWRSSDVSSTTDIRMTRPSGACATQGPGPHR